MPTTRSARKKSISSTGSPVQNDPFNATAQKLLPAEMWVSIFANLAQSKDLNNCSNACAHFSNLLEGSKQFWGFDLILPLILKRLDLRSILNCRLVCSEWQEAVDFLVEGSPANAPYNPDHDSFSLEPVRMGEMLLFDRDEPEDRDSFKNLAKPLLLTTPRSLDQLIGDAHTERLAGCRIIGGAVSMGRILHPPMDVYWNPAWRFLASYGSRIKFLILNNFYFHVGNSQDSLYLNLRGILRQCGNLRKLQVGEGWMPQVRIVAGSPTVSKITREEYPLPVLPHLESLLLDVVDKEDLQEVLLEEYSAQLKWLDFTLVKTVTDKTLRTLDKLTEMHVRVPQQGRQGTQHPLRRLLCVPAKQLQKLTLQMDHEMDLELDALLSVCENFPALKVLRVLGEQGMKMEGQAATPAGKKIRSLKILEFIDVVGVKTFNFLECFPSLEQLHLKGIYRTIEGRNNVSMRTLAKRPKPQYGITSKVRETVQIRKFLYPKKEEDYADMYESNLWTICPKLKRFSFEYRWTGHRYWLWNHRNYRPQHDKSLKECTVRTYTREELWELWDF